MQPDGDDHGVGTQRCISRMIPNGALACHDVVKAYSMVGR